MIHSCPFSCVPNTNIFKSLQNVDKYNGHRIVIAITYLFFKLLWPENSKGTFYRVKLPPAYLYTTHGGGFTLSPLMLTVK